VLHYVVSTLNVQETCNDLALLEPRQRKFLAIRRL
jgi:hypothetical protein